jgi:RNA polymerase-interacting CarD/CdnL/TRCF family regulator
MAFKIGDKVVHPEYGPGVIRALCQPGPGEPGREELVIVIPHRHTEIRVPCADLERIGLRRLIDADELPAISATMLRQPEPLPIDLPARQALLHRCLSGLHAQALAEVIRDLTYFFDTHFTEMQRVDYEVLNQAETLLSAQWALADDVPFEAAWSFVNKLIAEIVQYGRRP